MEIIPIINLFILGCPALSPPTNGHITFIGDDTAPYNLSTNAVYDCDVGYELIKGDVTRTCVNSNFQVQWSGIAPQCACKQYNYYHCNYWIIIIVFFPSIYSVSPASALIFVIHQESYSGVDDEYVGHPIPIPLGLPFGIKLHYTAYVSYRRSPWPKAHIPCTPL